MNKIDQHLEELFSQARTQSPEASFEETAARFTNTMSSVGTQAELESWISKIFSINGILVLTTGLIVIILALSTTIEPEHQGTNDHIGTSLKMSVLDPVTVQQLPKSIIPSTAKTKIEQKKKPKEVVIQPSIISSDQELKEPSVVLSSVNTFPVIKEARPIVSTQSKINLPVKIVVPTTFEGTLKIPETLFTLTELTSYDELDKISDLAAEAGIAFHFHVQHHSHVHENEDPRNPEMPLIRSFKAQMAINGTNISSQVKVRVPKRGKFELTIGWYLDEKGEAVRLTEDIVITNALSKHPKG